MNDLQIHFLGGTGTVTGSKFLLSTPETKILVDCGLFQGVKRLRNLNWQYLPTKVEEIDHVLLTHGHLDHTGFLPRLKRMGFKGKVWGTAPTLDIAKIILKDSAKIQMEDADRANRNHTSKHEKALPLYDLDDVDNVVDHFRSIDLEHAIQLSDQISVRFFSNGHIIGSTSIELVVGNKVVVFSGDVGRNGDPLLKDPIRPARADVLLIESTYGNRVHPEIDIKEKLSTLINTTIDLGGSVIIPSFSVERIQLLMYLIWQLHREKAIPDVPMIMDSPMGISVIDVFKRFPSVHRLSMADCDQICKRFKIIRNYKDSMEQVHDPSPKIVVAGSGMVTGGRVLAYLQEHLHRQESCVLLSGFQAEGTRGRKLLDGADVLKFYGKYYEVNCRVELLDGLSAHADQNELVEWMGELEKAPEKVFVIHGEDSAADELRFKITERFGYEVEVPNLYDIYDI